mgnify:CR=1 FL=1
MRKLKFVLAALLGFSAACSSVKNAPKASDEKQQTDSVEMKAPPRIVAMYGVRSPQPQSIKRMERMEQDSLAPVLERPADDMPETPVGKR